MATLANRQGDITSRRFAEIVNSLLRSSSSTRQFDAAIISVRIALAWIFIYYGAGKLFGAFNGPGIHRTAVYFATSAHLHPGTFFAVLGGVTEFAGALAIALGLGSRFAGAALFADQVMAMITVTWAHGINSLSNTPGYEFNITLAVLALVVTLLGAGRISVDHAIARRWLLSASVDRESTRHLKLLGEPGSLVKSQEVSISPDSLESMNSND